MKKQLLIDFKKLIDTHFNGENHLLCGHNGKEFDFPYIACLVLKYGYRLKIDLRRF